MLDVRFGTNDASGKVNAATSVRSSQGQQPVASLELELGLENTKNDLARLEEKFKKEFEDQKQVSTKQETIVNILCRIELLENDLRTVKNVTQFQSYLGKSARHTDPKKSLAGESRNGANAFLIDNGSLNNSLEEAP